VEDKTTSRNTKKNKSKTKLTFSSAGELLVTREDGKGGFVETKRLGHRGFRRYYKQQYSVPIGRASVLAAQKEHLLQMYRLSGIETSSEDMASTSAGTGSLPLPSRALTRRGLLIQRAVALSKEEKQLQRQLAHLAQCGGAKGNSGKGLAAQFTHRTDFADNAQNRAIVHHWGAGGGGSHYNMAASKSAQKGTKKGLLSRHSKQGAKLQAQRNMVRARDVAKGQMGVRNNASKGGGAAAAGGGSSSKKSKAGGGGGGKRSGGGGGD
jgi:hypothetical protein